MGLSIKSVMLFLTNFYPLSQTVMNLRPLPYKVQHAFELKS